MLGPHDQTEEDYIVACVTIDMEDLRKEFQRVSADLAYWNAQAADLEGDIVLSKAKLKEVEGHGHLNAPDILVANGKKATVDNCKACTAIAPSVIAAHKDLAEITGEIKRIKGICEAISRKGDMLVSLGAYIRSEHYAPKPT